MEPEGHSATTKRNPIAYLALTGTHTGVSATSTPTTPLVLVTCWGSTHGPDPGFREAEGGASGKEEAMDPDADPCQQRDQQTQHLV